MSGEGMIAGDPRRGSGRRTLEAVRAEERERVSRYIERYAARLKAGPPRRESFEHPVNQLTFAAEIAGHFATLLNGLASSIRAGVGEAEPRWPGAAGEERADG